METSYLEHGIVKGNVSITLYYTVKDHGTVTCETLNEKQLPAFTLYIQEQLKREPTHGNSLRESTSREVELWRSFVETLLICKECSGTPVQYAPFLNAWLCEPCADRLNTFTEDVEPEPEQAPAMENHNGCEFHACSNQALNRVTFHSGMSGKYCGSHTALYVSQGITDTVQSLVSEQVEKPYTCADCGKHLAFPEMLYYGAATYCFEHVPEYNKDEQF